MAKSDRDKRGNGSGPPPSDFDKFVSSALDSVVTMQPNADNPTQNQIITDATSGTIPRIDQTPAGIKDVDYLPPQAVPSTQRVRPSETLRMSNPEAYTLNSYQQMLREEEARIVNRDAGRTQPVPYDPNATDPSKKVQQALSLEEQTLVAYRATLRQDEERLAKLPPPPPAPPMPGLDSIVGVGHNYHGVKEPVFKEGADKLAVESYLLLRRMVAGQYINPFGNVYHDALNLLERMKGELEVPSVPLEKKA